MDITLQPITRLFRYNGISLPDIPGLSLTEVRDVYSAQFAELTSAEVVGGEVVDGVQEYEFRRQVGTKGSRPSAFSRAIDRAMAVDPADLRAQLPKLLDRPSHQRVARAFAMLADEAARVLEQPVQRLDMPAEVLAPLP